MRFLNSLQFRLYALFLLLGTLLAASIYIDLRAVERLSDQQRALNYASQQRSNSYLLATLSRRLSDATSEAEQASLSAAIQQTITRFDEIQVGLREGDADLELEPVTNRQIFLILDEVDERWATMRATLQTFVALPPAERANSPMLETIDTQSTIVFSYTDRVVAAFDALVEEDQRTIQRTFTFIAGLAAALLLLTVYVITRISRSMNSLSRTATSFSQADFTARANTHTLNEIAQVGQVFNQMASQISGLITSLQQRITETEAARHQAERSDQVKSAFLASMSHELRTPLNSIINFSKFVANGVMGPVNEEQKETLDEVIDSANHLLNLINDVLDMSKIESGSLNLLVEENVNVQALLENAVQTGRSLLHGKPVTLQAEIATDLPAIRADKQRVYQIFLNIISNACKFTDEGTIRIVAEQRQDQVHVAITDTGSGIAPEDQSLVFQPFKQTSSGLRQGGGTGLGMPISKNLAEAHGGHLWLESVPGQGSTFYVTIPVKSEQLTPMFMLAKETK